MNRAFRSLALVLVALSLSPAAMASQPFPDEIKAQLMLSAAPPCTLCHDTLIGGKGTVTTPFGRNLMDKYGLRQLDIPGLDRALMLAEQNGDNVDGDQVPDIMELRQGTDPNVPEGGVAAEGPKFGCYCTAVRARSGFSAAGAVWLAALALSGLRRKGAPRHRQKRQR
jgi:hypothetical protein